MFGPAADVTPAAAPRGASAIALAALLVFVAGLCLVPVTESDVFFRIKVGQQILAHRHLMERNLFSFTAPDHPDLDLAWGFEVGAALLYRLGGFPALVVGKTAVILLAFGLAFAACRQRQAGPASSALALAAAALVMRERFVERPHIVSFAGEAVVLLALGALSRRWSRARLAAFALAMLVWANGHAGVFAGVVMLLAAAASALALRRAPQARRALGLAAVVAASAFITPAGTGIVRYLSLHLSIPRVHVIDEFRTATFRSDAAFFALLAVTASLVVPFVLRDRRRAPALATDGAAALAMAALGLASVRFSADAALVLAPLLAMQLTAAFALVQERLRLRVGPRGAVALLAGALLVAAVAPRVAHARAGFFAIGLHPSMVPADALAFIAEHGLRERMYNDFETGSYLAFEGYPRYRVFIDPRLPAYPEDLHRLLGDFDMDRARWSKTMDELGVTTALLTDAGVNRRVSYWDPAEWALVFRASDARVFVRRLPVWRALIARFEIPATFQFTVEEGTTTLPIETPPPASPVPACEWARRLGDLTFELDGGRLTRALPAYDRALEQPGCLAPADEHALAAWLGAEALKQKRIDRAVERLDRAVALGPG
ncbi:MAG TPA: hypothetical protein VHU40_22345, partial [Polyangia bacterium]|nr:hypothetical protein [Polyangia bacterium]